MRLSARNQLAGKVAGITLGEAMAVVRVRLDDSDQTITASITRASAEDFALEEGAAVTVVIKSTDVMIAVDS